MKFIAVLLSILVMGKLAQAYSLPTKSVIGRSNLLTSKWPNNDAMTLLIKQNEYDSKKYWVVLAEYNRVPVTSVTVRSTITSWINRMYVYEMTQDSAKQFKLVPLIVSGKGDIVANENAAPSFLVIKDIKTLRGASLIRNNTETGSIEEVIQFYNFASSTWEDYVSGVFMWSQKTNGADYFNKRYNTVLSKDRKATFATQQVQGDFEIDEPQPGLFTFSPMGAVAGLEKIEGRIGVFIDVVNWKPLFNTEELFLINPNDARDVGFFYERNNKKAKD